LVQDLSYCISTDIVGGGLDSLRFPFALRKGLASNSQEPGLAIKDRHRLEPACRGCGKFNVPDVGLT